MDTKDRDFLQRIQATFRIEAEEHLKSFSVYMKELEKSETKEKQITIIESMFREVHSLKGAARSVGRKEMESVCQQLENLFSLLKRQEIEYSSVMIDTFYACSDLILKLIYTEANEQLPGEQQSLSELITQIEVFIAGEKKQENNEGLQIQKEVSHTENPFAGSSKAQMGKDFQKNIRPISTEAVRIPISKLNPLLLQAEEFIQSKITFNQLLKDLNVILKNIADLKSDSQKLKERKVIRSEKQWNEWQAVNELKLSNLEDYLTKLTRMMEKEGYGFERMVDDHLEAMKQVLLLPVASLTETFPTMVREISHDLNKEIEFVINGSDLEIDKRILEELKDPLIHLIRNSIDHGIGNRDERKLQGKDSPGHITLSFTAKESGMVEIMVADDGKGIDEEQVLKTALKSGLVATEMTEKLSRDEVLSMIYYPGFSTSKIITDLSGHGLGLSIVREKVEKLNGSLSLDTKVNVGTTFRILLPMTLSTFRGIMVSLGELMFIVPTINVKMALRVKADTITTVENHDTIRIGNEILSLVSLADALGIEERHNKIKEPHTTDQSYSDFVRIIVLAYGEKRLAFRVSEVLEEQQVLVKGLGGLLSSVRNISGATILGSGKIVPVLNIADLMKSGINSGKSRKVPVVEEEMILKTGKILVAEDSITSRTMLKNILETAGYSVTIAVDGLDAYTQVRSKDFDLIVSDVDMPRMNGFELTMKIKNDQKLNEIPVVLVTALESREDRERGIEAGADAYIIKSSFDQGNLLDVIKKLI